MHNPKAGQHKGIKFPEIKIMIATLSLAVMIGIWNLLSNQAVQASKVSPTPVVAPPPADLPGDNPLNAAVPTLVPLVDLSTISSVKVSDPVQSTVPVSQSGLPLRAAAIPTQIIVQKFKPLIEQPVQVITSGGGGGGGGRGSGGGGGGGGSVSAPPPVAHTGSSHP
jgi:hypothetical protein